MVRSVCHVHYKHVQGIVGNKTLSNCYNCYHMCFCNYLGFTMSKEQLTGVYPHQSDVSTPGRPLYLLL